LQLFGPRPRRAAFTLVEVVLAIGIAVFAVLGIFALTQGGLRTFRDSLNESVGVSIGQEMLSQYALADFKNIAGTPATTNYYDNRGQSVDSPTNGAAYRSVAEIIPAASLGLSTNNLVKLRIKITNPNQPFWSKTFVSFIARQGDDSP